MLNHRHFCLSLGQGLSHTTDPTLSPAKREKGGGWREAGMVWPGGKSAVCHTELSLHRRDEGAAEQKKVKSEAGHREERLETEAGGEIYFLCQYDRSFLTTSFFQRGGKEKPWNAGGLLAWLSVLIRRLGRVIRPCSGPCAAWWHTRLPALADKSNYARQRTWRLTESRNKQAREDCLGPLILRNSKLWIWQLFHYFLWKYRNKITNARALFCSFSCFSHFACIWGLPQPLYTFFRINFKIVWMFQRHQRN